jgi:hypothetical protein
MHNTQDGAAGRQVTAMTGFLTAAAGFASLRAPNAKQLPGPATYKHARSLNAA